MNHPTTPTNRRVLIIDDNPAIHADFRKILTHVDHDTGLAAAESELFGMSNKTDGQATFELTSALQGQEGLEKLTAALQNGTPFALAYVDVRMPPGWDGIETVTRLWEADPDLQVVVCTAYSDYSLDQMAARFGTSDKLVILKKPFDAIEAQQLANALTEKWNLTQQARTRLKDLEEAVHLRTRELQASNEQLRTEVQERQAAELTLRATQEKLNHFLAQNPAVLFSLRFESGGLAPAWVTENFTNFTGGSIEDWYRQTPNLDYVEDADRSIVTVGMERLLTEGQVSLQYRVIVKKGPSRWVRDDRRLVRDAAGRPVEVIGCWTDITEQRRLEDRLHQAQKMESVGQLAGGVAHDFNNLLMVVLGHVEMLLNYETFSPQTTEALERIQAAAERAGNLTRQLLAFSRKQIMRPHPMDLNEIITSITKLLGRTIGEHITVTTRCQPELPAVVADRSMIEQVIMNLAVNARDAMPDGGQVTIGTSTKDVDEDHLLRQPDARPGLHVCLSVKDTGCGIPEDILPRVFEPFFTTKEVGKGTGLGLATVYGNIKQHNGWVEVESRVGHGTTIKVYLPGCGQAASSGDSDTIRRAPRGGQETILVVEDESALGKLIRVTLQHQGYRVQTASTGAEALAVWAGRLNEIDLVVTDIVMPDGLTGWELAEEFHRIKPSLGVIYMSGYNSEITNGKLLSEKDICFLEKPFSPRKLAHVVRDRLDNVPLEEPARGYLEESITA